MNTKRFSEDLQVEPTQNLTLALLVSQVCKFTFPQVTCTTHHVFCCLCAREGMVTVIQDMPNEQKEMCYARWFKVLPFGKKTALGGQFSASEIKPVFCLLDKSEETPDVCLV